jgi:hypothetical protein
MIPQTPAIARPIHVITIKKIYVKTKPAPRIKEITEPPGAQLPVTYRIAQF